MDLHTASRLQSVVASSNSGVTSSCVQATGKAVAVKSQNLGAKFSSISGKSLNNTVAITSRRLKCNAEGRTTGLKLQAELNQYSSSTQTVRKTGPADPNAVSLKGKFQLSRLIGPAGSPPSIEFPVFQKNVAFTLVSTLVDGEGKLKLSARTQLEESWKALDLEDGSYVISFSVPRDFGEPGALLVDSSNSEEFYLQSLTLNSPDSSTEYEFACNSYINQKKPTSTPKIDNQISDTDRIFFTNKVYLPSDTPPGLQKLRTLEMEHLRGDGTGERQVADRIYDYDVYNDLGIVGVAERPTLGGPERPYPRRCRTGRKIDPESGMEVLPPTGAKSYIPRDEDWNGSKTKDFNTDGLIGLRATLLPILREKFDETPDDFDTFKEVYNLYNKGLDIFPKSPALQPSEKDIEAVHNFLESHLYKATGGVPNGNFDVIQYPIPQLLQDDPFAWTNDEEFARQALAGPNPSVIRRAQFPPTSELPEEVYGPATALTAEHIEPYLSSHGKMLTASEAQSAKRLFTIDYRDIYLPYVTKISTQTITKSKRRIYAPRVIFFLTDDNKLKPVAIELSLPPQEGQKGSYNRVFTPPKEENDFSFTWSLAKFHFSSVNFGFHGLISHWLKTHAVMEPFLIATNRQLSAMHPISVLLSPCWTNTMRINANARSTLINAAPIGSLESSFTPGRYNMEMNSVAYDKLWRFDKIALPEDLLDRGMAEPDCNEPGGVKLVFEDYPFAKDALDVWNTTKEYVSNYVNLFYSCDEQVREDVELEAWWKEIREVGHGDKKDEPWWPSCQTKESLVDILATILWIGISHSPVNFGQYAYGGFTLNYPPLTRELIPEPNTREYKEMLFNFERYVLKTTASPQQAVTIMTTMMVLSNHAETEEYIGSRNETNWTSDPAVKAVFEKYADQVREIARKIEERNADSQLQNRRGALETPGYTLMYPTSGRGVTGKGVPWSISI
ncbi:hypothetical protein AXG93_2381s1250 [Marchantia polymorpha subsp. ruderalis]|uniref:Lipoxygenase n=1 Tax=Marchantia polymorpha subsp. ruderalis TaxID=1480154 RepID=A0A176VNA9_MARPO|nr:hypothetical protein AXG93_2381s1250 [Marchantia polymorpha subsp. ruderalis]